MECGFHELETQPIRLHGEIISALALSLFAEGNGQSTYTSSSIQILRIQICNIPISPSKYTETVLIFREPHDIMISAARQIFYLATPKFTLDDVLAVEWKDMRDEYDERYLCKRSNKGC